MNIALHRCPKSALEQRISSLERGGHYLKVDVLASVYDVNGAEESIIPQLDHSGVVKVRRVEAYISA